MHQYLSKTVHEIGKTIHILIVNNNKLMTQQ